MAINAKNFKTKLEKEKKLLEEELKGLGTMDKKTGDWEATPNLEEISITEADENDRADRGEDFQERTSTLNTLEIRLREVEAALKRISTKEYGKCKVCGKEIENDRLEANPAAETCKAHL